MRRARELARRQLPCARCGSGREPVLRRPRYLSAGWRRDPNAYLACADCSVSLQPITGAAAMRESDIAADRVPDPQGAVTGFDLAAGIEAHFWSAGEMPGTEWMVESVREGVSRTSPSVSSRIDDSVARFSHLGSTWINVGVTRTGPGEDFDPGRRAFHLSAEASFPEPEALFLVTLAPSEACRISDNDPEVRLPEDTRLLRAIEVAADGEPWQVRYYSVAQGLFVRI